MRQNFDVDKFIEDRKIDETNLSLHMACNADLLGFYAYQHALWSEVVDNLKQQIKTKSAQHELDIKDTGEKFTESTVKAKIALNPEIIKLEKAVIVAESQKRQYGVGVTAIEHKGKQLTSIGFHQKAEMENLDMHIPSPTKPRMTREQRDEMLKKIMDNNQ